MCLDRICSIKFDSKAPEEGTVSIRHLLFGKLGGNGWYYGSDGKRSPLHIVRNPGEVVYTGAYPGGDFPHPGGELSVRTGYGGQYDGWMLISAKKLDWFGVWLECMQHGRISAGWLIG